MLLSLIFRVIVDGSETAKNSNSQPDLAQSDRRTQVQRSSVQVKSKESFCVPEKSLKLSYSFLARLTRKEKKRALGEEQKKAFMLSFFLFESFC